MSKKSQTPLALLCLASTPFVAFPAHSSENYGKPSLKNLQGSSIDQVVRSIVIEGENREKSLSANVSRLDQNEKALARKAR
jgi:hypothetical protein